MMEKMNFNISIWDKIRAFLLHIDIELSLFVHRAAEFSQQIEVQWMQRGIVVLVGIFMIITSLISHIQIKKNNITMAKEMLRRTGKETMGGRVFFYCMMIFCASTVWYGMNPFAGFFAVAALLSERLIVYRVCRGMKDPVSRFLTKINW